MSNNSCNSEESSDIEQVEIKDYKPILLELELFLEQELGEGDFEYFTNYKIGMKLEYECKQTPANDPYNIRKLFIKGKNNKSICFYPPLISMNIVKSMDKTNTTKDASYVSCRFSKLIDGDEEKTSAEDMRRFIYELVYMYIQYHNLLYGAKSDNPSKTRTVRNLVKYFTGKDKINSRDVEEYLHNADRFRSHFFRNFKINGVEIDKSDRYEFFLDIDNITNINYSTFQIAYNQPLGYLDNFNIYNERTGKYPETPRRGKEEYYSKFTLIGDIKTSHMITWYEGKPQISRSLYTLTVSTIKKKESNIISRDRNPRGKVDIETEGFDNSEDDMDINNIEGIVDISDDSDYSGSI